MPQTEASLNMRRSTSEVCTCFLNGGALCVRPPWASGRRTSFVAYRCAATDALNIRARRRFNRHCRFVAVPKLAAQRIRLAPHRNKQPAQATFAEHAAPLLLPRHSSHEPHGHSSRSGAGARLSRGARSHAGKGAGGAWLEASGTGAWLKALVALAVVGIVLLDVYLLEAVLERARARDASLAAAAAAAAGALAPPPSGGRRGAAAAAAALRGRGDASAAATAAVTAAALAARNGAIGARAGEGGRLLVLKELAQSALAIVPRGAGSSAARGRHVGDDGAAAAAAAGGTAGGRGGSSGGRGAGATLRLLGGLLPTRLQEGRVRARREWSQLRQRYTSLGATRRAVAGGGRVAAAGGAAGANTAAAAVAAAAASLPPELRLPAATAQPLGDSLVSQPPPFVGLRDYANATAEAAARGRAADGADADASIPPDFDWRAYLDYNPDVRRFGATTPALAAAHYAAYGRREGRVYRRVAVVLRYTACGGLFNQHYSHVAALSLALALGADVILPAAVKRDSFASYFSQDASKNRVSWEPAPFDSLWDGAALRGWLAARGADAAEAPAGAPLPDLARPGTAFQRYKISEIAPRQVVELRDVYLAANDFGDLVSDLVAGLAHQAQVVARPAAGGAAGGGAAEGRREFPPLVLDVPCALFSVATRDLPLAAAVARALRFAPPLEALADAVVAGIVRAHGGGGGGSSGGGSGGGAAAAARGAFNGLHLRIERDAADWTSMMGGREAFWGAYLDAAAAAGLDAGTPLYIATGLLSYQDADHEMEDVQRR